MTFAKSNFSLLVLIAKDEFQDLLFVGNPLFEKASEDGSWREEALRRFASKQTFTSLRNKQGTAQVGARLKSKKSKMF